MNDVPRPRSRPPLEIRRMRNKAARMYRAASTREQKRRAHRALLRSARRYNQWLAEDHRSTDENFVDIEPRPKRKTVALLLVAAALLLTMLLLVCWHGWTNR